MTFMTIAEDENKQVTDRGEQIIDSDIELNPDDPESALTDIEWIEQEPTRLKKINLFKKPKHKWKGQLEELRQIIEAFGARLDIIESSIPGLEHGVVTWNTRWGHVVFNQADLLSADGATRTWVQNLIDSIPGIGNVIDGGIY